MRTLWKTSCNERVIYAEKIPKQLLSKNCHNTELLFSVINSAINPVHHRTLSGETDLFFYPSPKA